MGESSGESSNTFTQPVAMRWADLDPNGHVRHSVYYDWGTMARVTFLESEGVGLQWLASQGLGPILFREEARFLREIRMSDQLRIDVRLAGASPDVRKWRMRHNIYKGDEVAAVIEVDGAWMDLRARKIVPAPPELVRAFSAVTRTDDFTDLASARAR